MWSVLEMRARRIYIQDVQLEQGHSLSAYYNMHTVSIRTDGADVNFKPDLRAN